MGIPGFASWLKQRYPQAFGELKPQDSYDNVYIDLQSTLHVVTRKARSKHGFHSLLHRRLDEILASLGPSKRVVLAMDGPAPLAKLLEQRRRRRKESDRSDARDDDAGVPPFIPRDSITTPVEGVSAGINEEAPRRRPAMAVSPLNLTTGTIFMLEVHNSLACYIISRLTSPKFSHIHFELSDSTVKGEGELKILSRLVQAEADGRRPESHAIVGADSDLLLMAMVSGCKNLVVCDDRPPNKALRGGKGYSQRPGLFSEAALVNAWKKEGALSATAGQRDIQNLALDLALLAMLCSGNDYLPGCQGLQLKNKARPGLWNLYLGMKQQPEWQGQNLCLINQMNSWEKVTPAEPANASEYNDSSSSPSHAPSSVSLNGSMVAALLQRYQDQRSAPFNNSKNTEKLGDCWEYSATDGPVLAPHTYASQQPVNRLPPDTSAYVQGLEWVLSMLLTGSIEDYRFAYPAAAPLVSSLIGHLEGASPNEGSLNGEITSETTITESGALDGNTAIEDVPVVKKQPAGPRRASQLQPLIPAACALALLPASSRRQAASPLRHLMDADNSPIAEIYAVCAECQRIATNIRGAANELDGVRKELGALQDKLDGAGIDSEGALEAESDLAAAVDRWENAGERLRDLLRGLSRSQREHVMAKHPYKPFPTEQLEAAVKLVSPEMYAPWERKLARFGREMLFKAANQEEIQASSSEDEVLLNEVGVSSVIVATTDVNNGVSPPGGPMPGWIRDCARFAAAYPRVASQQMLRGAAVSVAREILPLHPYMQPGARSRGRSPPPPMAATGAVRFGVRGFAVRAFATQSAVYAASSSGGVVVGVGARRSAMHAALVTCAQRVLPRVFPGLRMLVR